MKLLEMLKLFYQYAYYWNVELDKSTWKGQLPIRVSKSKAIVVFCTVETLIILSLHIVLSRALGFGVHEIPYPLLTMGALSLALIFYNDWLVGPEEQIEHYRKIFDGWHTKKRRQWTFYVIFVMISSFVFFVIAVQTSRKILEP